MTEPDQQIVRGTNLHVLASAGSWPHFRPSQKDVFVPRGRERRPSVRFQHQPSPRVNNIH